MDGAPLFEYRHAAHNRSLFTEAMLATLHRGFGFTRGAPVLRMPARPDAKRSSRQGGFADASTVLYDLAADPRQLSATMRDMECPRAMPSVPKWWRMRRQRSSMTGLALPDLTISHPGLRPSLNQDLYR